LCRVQHEGSRDGGAREDDHLAELASHDLVTLALLLLDCTREEKQVKMSPCNEPLVEKLTLRRRQPQAAGCYRWCRWVRMSGQQIRVLTRAHTHTHAHTRTHTHTHAHTHTHTQESTPFPLRSTHISPDKPTRGHPGEISLSAAPSCMDGSFHTGSPPLTCLSFVGR
jgi:hypothetical protein